MTHHVITVMDMTSTTYAHRQEVDTETVHVQGLVLHAAGIEDVMIPLVAIVATVLCMESIAAEIATATETMAAVEAVVATMITAAVDAIEVGAQIVSVGVRVLVVTMNSHRHQLRSGWSMILPFPRVKSKVLSNPSQPSKRRHVLILDAVYSRTLFVGGVT